MKATPTVLRLVSAILVGSLAAMPVHGDIAPWMPPLPFGVVGARSGMSRSHSPTTSHAVLEQLRGGSDSLYEEDEDDRVTKKAVELEEVEAEEDDEEEEEDMDNEEYDDVDEALLRDSNIIMDDDDDEDLGDLADLEEEDEFQIEQEEIFDEDVFEDAIQDEEELEPEEALKEEPEDVPLTTQVLEKATAMTTATDDENSSAFVDRMDLADAYDDEEEEDDTELGAASAVEVEIVPDMAADADADTASALSTQEEEEQLPVSMTDEMREILIRDLHFKKRDVEVMRPDIAAMVVANNLRKPIEGMPPNWYIAGASPKAVSLRKKLVRATLSVAVVGGVVLLGTKVDDLEDLLENVGDTLKSIPGALAAIPAALLKGSSSSSLPSAESQAEAEAEDGVVAEEEEEDHPHSVKPGSSEPPLYEQDLDKSGLDKVLTKIENSIKGFFRITI